MVVEARTFKKLEVPQGLESHLNAILRGGDALHAACVSRNEEQVDQKLDQLIILLDRALKQTRLMGLQKTHIDRILLSTQAIVSRTRKKHGEARIEPLKSTMTSLVQIQQVFKVDKYNVFFCSKDQSVWIQKDKVPQNPIHPRDLKNCGKQVP